MTIWECKIGFAGSLPANAKLNQATQGLQRIVSRKFVEIVGKKADFVFCKVGDLLEPDQRKEVSGPVTAFCLKIGVRDDVSLPNGADILMRTLAEMMFDCLFRKEATFNFSGWNACLNAYELKIIEG